MLSFSDKPVKMIEVKLWWGHKLKAKIRGDYWTPARYSLSVCAGGLSLAVEGPSKAEISCKDNKDGTCTVSYLPTAPGDYNIIVKFDDKHIPGSPFTAKITGTETLFVVFLCSFSPFVIVMHQSAVLSWSLITS